MRDWRRSPRWCSPSARPNSCGGASRGRADGVEARDGRHGTLLGRGHTLMPRSTSTTISGAEMNALERLKSLFRELFQLDLADLDFGIYRLLHLKRKEVEAFLTQDLPEAVEKEFKAAAGAE